MLRVDIPVTERVPFDESEEVAVIDPPVTEEEVRVVREAFVAVTLVKNPDTAVTIVEKRLVVVAEVPIAERKLSEAIVEEAIVVVAKVEVPTT